ncbi:hypothetical protein S100390_v1c06620 [Spiroplasma sp. NBRC 100390]|uniref:hypothetical protein n=1 Tax=unclassified Spiroplasma TaxID=2637901 RepID=UPI0008929425|nr:MULTISPECIES: hypothetical protein [unclassified Spiroplasma]AOX43999.1 hypothetical protein STU14_v1c06620 [Spiroplasma sp. TU-14]APE13469.1 hypothetical protein S100390_v1c06620 [Spiroplasma sp. NBRC 100390]
MKTISVKTLCDKCQIKLKQKLIIVKNEKKEFLKNAILLEIKDLEIVKKRKEHNIKILVFLQCAKRRFGIFTKESLSDENQHIKAIVQECLFNSDEEDEIINVLLEEHNLVKKEVNLPVLIKANPVSVDKKGYLQNRHLAMTRYHRFCCATQMKRHVLIIWLLLILLIAASLGTTLGLYFSQTELGPNIVTDLRKWPRVSLGTVLKNQMLGKIQNNTSTTILNAIKAKNPDLKTEDVFIQNIVETKARVYVKSSSIYYVDNSYVDVYFYPDRLTINTHLSNLVLWEKVDQLTPENILTVTKNSNPKLVVSQIIVQNIAPNQASIIATVNNTTYVDNDMVTIYFNTSGKKLLSADLQNVNLGKIENKKPTTILAAVKAKNPNVVIDEVAVDLKSINSRQASIVVKTESSEYIATSSVIVNYALLNMRVGQIKDILFREETGWGEDGIRFSKKNKITQFNNGDIVLPSQNGILSQIDLNSKILKRKSDSFFPTAIIKLQDDVFWGQKYDTVYQYKYVWDDWQERGAIFNDPDYDYGNYSTLTLLQDGTVLATWGKNIYHLSSTGTKVGFINGKYFANDIQNVIQLSNGKIWVQTDEIIYELDLYANSAREIFNIKSNPWIKPSTISAITPLQDGTVLIAGAPLSGNGRAKYDMYVLNAQGSIQNYFTNYDKPFVEHSTITSLIQVQDGTLLALATGEKWRIYQLNTE